MAMTLKLHGAGGQVEVSEAAFGKEFNEALVHQVVTAYMAQARSGTKAQKNRAAVRGGGIKPWRQKGTGRARAGTIRSPIWVGGGRTFAAQPRDYGQKVNRKMYRAAMQSMFSELVRQERLLVVEEFGVDEPKTKQLAVKNVLILNEAFDEKLFLASRNLPHVEVIEATGVDPVSLARFEHVLITVPAVKRVEERLA